MRSPAVRPAASATSLPTPTTGQEVEQESKRDVAAEVEPAPQVEAEAPSIPSGSAPSLTPPPASEPAMDMDEDAPVEEEKEEAMDGDDQWETYRRSRQVRSFGTAKPSVKLEPGDDDEATPGRAKPIKLSSALSVPTASGADTPTSGIEDERAGSASRSQGRKRRGEEQLLLDDHLLPEELRRIGSGMNKKGKTEEEDENDEPAEEPAEEDNEEGAPEVTRCVCQKEGKSNGPDAADIRWRPPHDSMRQVQRMAARSMCGDMGG